MKITKLDYLWFAIALVSFILVLIVPSYFGKAVLMIPSVVLCAIWYRRINAWEKSPAQVRYRRMRDHLASKKVTLDSNIPTDIDQIKQEQSKWNWKMIRGYGMAEGAMLLLGLVGVITDSPGLAGFGFIFLALTCFIQAKGIVEIKNKPPECGQLTALEQRRQQSFVDGWVQTIPKYHGINRYPNNEMNIDWLSGDSDAIKGVRVKTRNDNPRDPSVGGSVIIPVFLALRPDLLNLFNFSTAVGEAKDNKELKAKLKTLLRDEIAQFVKEFCNDQYIEQVIAEKHEELQIALMRYLVKGEKRKPLFRADGVTPRTSNGRTLMSDDWEVVDWEEFIPPAKRLGINIISVTIGTVKGEGELGAALEKKSVEESKAKGDKVGIDKNMELAQSVYDKMIELGGSDISEDGDAVDFWAIYQEIADKRHSKTNVLQVREGSLKTAYQATVVNNPGSQGSAQGST